MVAEERVQRRLAAILAADVVGYSRMMREDEGETLAQIKSLRSELIEPKVAEFGGRIFKTTGDGFLIEFPSAVDAVQHAIDVQGAMFAHNAGVSEHRQISLRMGITLGDVIDDGDDIYGDGVNIASRLEGIAEPGGITASLLIRESVRHKLAVDFEDLGEKSVKNIADPIHVFQVQRDKSDRQAGPQSDATFRRPAVAVLPFENMSGDPEQEYFVDGLTEDIITALSLWRSFPVIARNSSFAYKGQSPDIRKVGKELGARYVVEGSVRKSGSRVRVTAQLINAETGHHIWAERYDRELKDIFDLQDEITHHIAAIIEPAIEQTEHLRIVSKPPSNLDAWEYCLRAYAYIYEGTPEGNRKARELLKRAIDLDPNYARAYTGLAYTYARDIRWSWVENTEEWLRLQFESARRAVTLDERDSAARTMLARAYMHDQQCDAAVTEAKRAIELNPHDAFANNTYGATLALYADRYEEGISWIEKALRLNPLEPQKHLWLANLALSHLCAGNYEKAAEYAKEVLGRQPEFFEAKVTLASALGQLGRAQEARTVIAGHEDEVQGWNLWRESVHDIVRDGLRKAGWKG